MEVAVNTRLLLKNRLEGIGYFASQTLQRVVRAHPEVHFTFIFDRPFDVSFIYGKNVTPVIVGPQARHPFLYYSWLQFGIKPLLKKLRPDLFLSPDGFVPLDCPCPVLPVIHDINFVHYPKHSKWLTSKYYNHFFPRFAREAKRIATVSEFSRSEIARHFHIPDNKIDVIPNGINPFFRILSEEECVTVRRRHTNGKEYFIYVGSIHPRKNIPVLLEAYATFRKQSSSDMKLVLAGPSFWGNAAVRDALRKTGFEEDIIFTGRVDERTLAELTGAAKALTFIPLYEGFGIPVIEAMAAGTPVITSNVSSLPEVAGGAAMLVAPDNVNDVAYAMQRMQDEETRKSYIAKGIERSKEFSWDRSADLLWRSMLAALETG